MIHILCYSCRRGKAYYVCDRGRDWLMTTGKVIGRMSGVKGQRHMYSMLILVGAIHHNSCNILRQSTSPEVAMACMITLHLRALGPEIEKPTHPSHKSWQKSLKLLRDFVKIKPTSKHAIRWEQSYYCADKERPDEVIYFYRKNSPLWLCLYLTNPCASLPLRVHIQGG